MRRPRAGLVSRHSGDAGLRPGALTTPRQELADAEPPRFARDTDPAATRKGSRSVDGGQAKRRDAKRGSGIEGERRQWSAERRPRCPKGSADYARLVRLEALHSPRIVEGGETCPGESGGWKAAYPGPSNNTGGGALANSLLSSPRKRGPIRGAFSISCGVWVPALATLGRDDAEIMARSAARIIRGPGQAAFHPPLWRGEFLPLGNPRGMERLEAHQSCVIRTAFWTARAPLGAPLAAFFLAIPGPRFASPRFDLPPARIATPCGRPRRPCLGQVLAAQRQPAPGRGSLGPPGGARHRPRAGLRGRRAGAASTGASAPRLREGGCRISGTGLSRRLRHQDRL
jgi:hypothetical protein